MAKLYNAVNPQQIIDMFERRADRRREQATNAKPTIRDVLLREAYTWGEAADILRNTDFVGWDLAAAATLRDPNAPPITKKDYDWPAERHDIMEQRIKRDKETLRRTGNYVDRYFPTDANDRAFRESQGWRTREDGSMFKPGN